MAKSYRERVVGLFQKRSAGVFRFAEIVAAIPDVKPPVIRYYLKQLIRDETLIQPSYGRYQYNPSVKKSIDYIREEALRLGKERVVQDKDIMFRPAEQVITAVENVQVVALQKKVFGSIIERMKANPNIYTKFDIEFLIQHNRDLVEEEKRNLAVAS